MTTEELKAHRRAICEALIEGKQCQYHSLQEDVWVEHCPVNIVSALFGSAKSAHRVRIKPEPRKVWVGWRGSGYVPVLAEDEESFQYLSNKYPAYKWIIVEEPQ